MQYNSTFWIIIEKGSLDKKTQLSPVLFTIVTCACQMLSIALQVKREKHNIEANESRCNYKQVNSLRQNEAKEVGMVTTADTIVEPLAMMVKTVHAAIANKAVPAPRQDYDSTCRANFMHIELFQQVHHRDIFLTLNYTRSKYLHKCGEHNPHKQCNTNCRLQPLLLWQNHIWKNEHHQKQLRHKHDHKETNHCFTWASDLVNGLLELKCASDPLTAGFIDFHDIFKHLNDYFEPIIVLNPVDGVFKWSATFTLLYERTGLLHQQESNDGCRLYLLGLGYGKV